MIDVRPMRLGSSHTDAERDGDLLVALSFRQQLNDLALARRNAAISLRVFRSPAIHVVAKEHIRHGGCQEWFVMEQSVHRRDEMNIGIGFKHVTSGAGPENFARDLFGLMHRQNQDFRSWKNSDNLPGSIQSV